MAEILSLVPSVCDLTDVPARLRQLADALEQGEYGDIKDPEFLIRASLVLRVSAREPMVFAWGNVDNTATTYMDLHAGAHQLMMMKSPGRT